MVDRSEQEFRPGDRALVRATRERVTITAVQLRAYIDGLDGVHVFNLDDLELIDEAADYAADVSARIAADVAASGRTDADLAGQLGIDPQEFRRLVDGRRDWIAPKAVRLAHLLDVPLSRWFDDEPPVDRIVRRASASAPVVRTMREIPDDEPGTGRFGLICDECRGVVCLSRYPLPPVSVVCMACGGVE
ncbi:hypothetical protein [Nocardia cyriacigeorgica]|uniref:hypothetical protein n=1 Tax=Nocardia cyriacigeorgica TaxID=135487 RepID=UPI001895CABC|nr:hypothetical protein [Nocardia cyriacigeorgica]MBF6286917.1 hypothetical protein [Nocardia cyriacigeorgica]